MNVMIVGGGGREHALCWKAAQSDAVAKVFCAPGNAGTARESKVENVPIDVLDIEALVAFAKRHDIALTIIGPEAPLVAGIVDAFQAASLACFGPVAAAAQLEGSKAFMKAFLRDNDIPTARWDTFEDVAAATTYIHSMTPPIVVKADGLAAGKGVVIAQSHDEAIATAKDMLSGDAFGAAGTRIVVEEFLAGEEASFIAMCDGDDAVVLASSQDHKARDDGDEGPNTGGMGAYSPAPIIDAKTEAEIMESVIYPTLRGMRDAGTPYVGFLYAGLMMMPDGSPRVLEFNCRFGDPETQPILSRLRSDLVETSLAVLNGEAGTLKLDWDSRSAVGVVMAAGGYPASYDKGDVIGGLDDVSDAVVFHAGTKLDGDDVVTNGGRVLCVVGLGDSITDAAAKAYGGVDQISWRGAFCRRDIGYRAIARERTS